MSHLIYGVFDDMASAEAAVAAIDTDRNVTPGEPGASDVFIHVGKMDDNDIPFTGTQTLRWMAFGSLVVGLFAATIAGTVIAPRADMPFGLVEFAIIVLAGTLFGTVAGAVSGCSEAKAPLERVAKMVKSGKIAVTIDSDAGHHSLVAQALRQQGAIEVGAA